MYTYIYTYVYENQTPTEQASIQTTAYSQAQLSPAKHSRVIAGINLWVKNKYLLLFGEG